MGEDSFRRHCWLSAVLGTFGMLLALRGMGLNLLMKPEDVRWCLSILLCFGILSLLASLCFLHLYIPSHHARKAHKARPMTNSPGMYGSTASTTTVKRAWVYMDSDSPTRQHQSISSFLSHYSHVIAVYVFGGGGIMLNLCYVVYTSLCIGFFSQMSALLRADLSEKVDEYTYGDEVTRIISTLLKLIFFMMQIPYLHYLSTIKYTKQKTASQYLFLPIMGANFSIWLYTFLDETKLIQIFHFPYPTEPYTHSLGTACLNHSTVLEVYIRGSLEKVFYPMSMEFCLTSLEILYHAYFVPVLPFSEVHVDDDDQLQVLQRMKELIGTDVPHHVRHISLKPRKQVDDERIGDSVLHPPTIEINIMVPVARPTEEPKSLAQKLISAIFTMFSPCTALKFGLIEATLIKIFLLHDETIEDGYISISYLTDVFKIPLMVIRVSISSFVPLLLTLCCVYIVKQYPRKDKSPRETKWSLFLGLIGITLISVFQIAVCVEKIIGLKVIEDDGNKLWLYILALVESALYWPEYFSLAFLIHLAQKCEARTSHPMYKVLQGALSYLAMKNFMDWGINSFIETDYIRNRVDLADNIAYWDLLVHLAIPTAVYFRFTCTFLLLDVKHLLSTSRGGVVGGVSSGESRSSGGMGGVSGEMGGASSGVGGPAAEGLEHREDLTQWRLAITMLAKDGMDDD